MNRLWLSLALLTVVACHSSREAQQVIAAALTVDSSPPAVVAIGKPFHIKFALRNRSTVPVNACLGTGVGIRLLDASGHSATNVGEPRRQDCLTPFTLLPGETLPLSSEFVVPSTLLSGPALLSVGAYVLDTTHCYEPVGCPSSWIASPWLPSQLETEEPS